MNTPTIGQNPHIDQRGIEDDEQQVREVSQGYSNCFGCGEDNPIGLCLKYRFEGDALVTDFTPGSEHEGWPGIVNGGIIATSAVRNHGKLRIPQRRHHNDARHGCEVHPPGPNPQSHHRNRAPGNQDSP